MPNFMPKYANIKVIINDYYTATLVLRGTVDLSKSVVEHARRTPFQKQPKKAAPEVPSWLLLPSVVVSHWLSTTQMFAMFTPFAKLGALFLGQQ